MTPYGDSRPPRPAVRPDAPAAPHLLAVGGGKGGVGKTLMTANLAAALAMAGRRVVAVDTDLEGANLHTVLGVPTPRASLADFVAKRETDLRKLLVDTPIPGLRLVAGTNGHLGTPQPRSFRRVALLSELRKLPADHVLVDLGAGTHPSVMDYFLVGDDGILVMNPEPTSVENAYSFLRAAFYRRLRLAMTSETARKLVHQAMDQGNERGIRTPLDLLREVRALAPEEGDRFASAVQSFKPRIVVNAARTAEDVRLGFAVRSVCKKYFGIEADYVGYVNHDEAVTQAIRQRRPVVVTHPNSDAAVYLVRIARKLLDATRRPGSGRPAPRPHATSTSSWARRPIA